MKQLGLFLLVSVFLCACGGPTLYKTVRYSRLSVNTVMVATQEADSVNGAHFEEAGTKAQEASFEARVLPVAKEYGLENEDSICSMEGPTPEATEAMNAACDLGYAQWCSDIKPIWRDHCLRTCIIHTTKDGLRAVEKTVDALQYIQENYSADSKFKQLKEADKLKWTDYALQVKQWFQMALVQLGSLIHLFHETGITIPEALNVVTDISGGFANMPHNYEAPACDCPAFPPNSECAEAVKLLEP